MKLQARSLQDLGALRTALAEARAQALAREAERREAERRARAEAELFVRAVGPVRPIAAVAHARVHHPKPRPAPLALQQQRDEAAVMREALSDEFDVGTLLETDEHLSYRRPGIGPDVTRRLRSGEWRVQAELDLHGLRRDDARTALSHFIREAMLRGLRCVRVVHGKGLGSPGKTPVLKSRVHSWLVQKAEVLAFVQARPAEGGSGALLVLLRGQRGPARG
ncbi:Smr/MutS family protein [Tibeticola sp.]|uniref:Smr/MutS family protein n=1 Tax=Tibeticola sp. TaxID=2005368 RepID=UPI0025F69176|nr:Smr/MutS family protein [Tibeticola sp.]